MLLSSAGRDDADVEAKVVAARSANRAISWLAFIIVKCTAMYRQVGGGDSQRNGTSCARGGVQRSAQSVL